MNKIETLDITHLSENQKLTKSELIQLSEAYIDQLLADKPTLEVLETVTRLTMVLDVMTRKVREKTKQEYTGNPGQYKNIQIEFRGGRKTYDFSNDETWKQLQKVIKEHESFLKTLKQVTTVVDEETGESTSFAPPVVKQSDTTMVVNLV